VDVHVVKGNSVVDSDPGLDRISKASARWPPGGSRRQHLQDNQTRRVVASIEPWLPVRDVASLVAVYAAPCVSLPFAGPSELRDELQAAVETGKLYALAEQARHFSPECAARVRTLVARLAAMHALHPELIKQLLDTLTSRPRD
jgi:hypothetical protein